MEKAASPVETPQVTTPAVLILSSVGPASADVAPSATASAKPSKLRDFIRSSVAFSRSPNVLGSMRFYTREPSVSRTLSRRRFRPQCQPLYLPCLGAPLRNHGLCGHVAARQHAGSSSLPTTSHRCHNV